MMGIALLLWIVGIPFLSWLLKRYGYLDTLPPDEVALVSFSTIVAYIVGAVVWAFSFERDRNVSREIKVMRAQARIQDANLKLRATLPPPSQPLMYNPPKKEPEREPRWGVHTLLLRTVFIVEAETAWQAASAQAETLSYSVPKFRQINEGETLYLGTNQGAILGTVHEVAEGFQPETEQLVWLQLKNEEDFSLLAECDGWYEDKLNRRTSSPHLERTMPVKEDEQDDATVTDDTDKEKSTPA